ncbi:MAG: alpha/beta hydrolase [Acidobacteriota bacterium]
MKRVLIGVGLLVLIGVGIAVGFLLWMRGNPIEMGVWIGRKGLEDAGLHRQVDELTLGDGTTSQIVSYEGGFGELGTVVLLHGAGDQAGAWRVVARPLREAGWRVIALDAPGHGDSDPADGPLPFDKVVGGVTAFLDTELAADDVPEPVVLVGHSMGAWLASYYALDRADTIDRVVLVNGGPLRSTPPEGVSLMPADREEARAVMAAMRDPSAAPVPDFVLDDVVEHMRDGAVGRMFAAPESFEPYVLDGQLGGFAVPVDVIWGMSDRYFEIGYEKRLLAELPVARLHPLETCGHVPTTECPASFTELLLEVLALPAPIAEPSMDEPSDVEPSVDEPPVSGPSGEAEASATAEASTL